MRPGQAAPEYDLPDHDHTGGEGASMRPGQAAPEYSSSRMFDALLSASFNEAGAGCPGIHPDLAANFKALRLLQ